VAACLTAGWCAAGSERNLTPSIRLECVGLDAAPGEYLTIGDVAPPQPAPPTPIVGPAVVPVVVPVVHPVPADVTTAVSACETEKIAIDDAQRAYDGLQSEIADLRKQTGELQVKASQAMKTQAEHRTALGQRKAELEKLLATLYPVPEPAPEPEPAPAPKPPAPEPPASGVVLVQISSNTCPWCKGAEAVADAVKAAGLSVIKINSDQDTAVKTKYKPLQFPTWVIENNGVEVNRATGSMTAAVLREWVESNRKFIENDGRQ
jgi:hypothetical protein